MLKGYMRIDPETSRIESRIKDLSGPQRAIRDWVFSELESLKSRGYMLVPVSDFRTFEYSDLEEYKMDFVRVPNQNCSPWEVVALQSRFSRRLDREPTRIITLEITCSQRGSKMHFLFPDEDLEDALVGIGWKISIDDHFQPLLPGLPPISVRKDLTLGADDGHPIRRNYEGYVGRS